MDIALEIAKRRARGEAWKDISKRLGYHEERARSLFRRWKQQSPDEWENIKKEIGPAIVEISGVFPDDNQLDPSLLWEQAIAAQLHYQQLADRRKEQTITIHDGRPIGIAFLGDLHIGGPGVDYIQAREDARIIGATDGMYAAEHGDGIDNWIVGKLQAQQRGQVIGFEAERQLFFSWVDMMREKWLWWIPGNHPLWTYKLAGIDPFREKLRGVKTLYDRHEVYLTLRLGDAKWKILARHKWRHSSVFNPTHGIEVSWERRGLDFDIGIGGHTHVGTLCREFIKHNRKRFAIQLGTYKLDGDYGRELGMPEPVGRGCGAMIFFPDGRLHWCRELVEAADYLKFLRSRS